MVVCGDGWEAGALGPPQGTAGESTPQIRCGCYPEERATVADKRCNL